MLFSPFSGLSPAAYIRRVMGDKLAGDFGFNVAINLAVKVIWLLGIEVAVQNALGPEVYGQYFVFWNLCSLFYILLDFGLTQYVQRRIGRQNEEAAGLAANLLPVKAILALCYIAIIFAIAAATAIPKAMWPLLAWVAFNQVLVSLLHFLRAFVAAFKQFRLDGLLSVSDRLVAIIICGAFLWMPSGGFQVWHFLIALSAGWGTACLLSFLALRHRLKVRMQPPVATEMRNLLSTSWPYGVFIALMTAYTRVDAVMLEILLPDGAYHAGIYAGAYRLLDAANIFGLLLAGILLPSFAAVLHHRSEIQHLVNTGLRLIWIPAVAVVIFTWFNAPAVFETLYKADTLYGGSVLRVLLLNFLPVCLIYIYSTLLTAHGDLRLLNILTGITLVANVLLNLWLIPQSMAEGAAIATLATQGFFALICIYFSVKIYGRSLVAADYLKLMIVAVACAFTGFFTHKVNMHWLAAGMVILTSGVVAGFASRLLSLGVFREMLNLRKG